MVWSGEFFTATVCVATEDLHRVEGSRFAVGFVPQHYTATHCVLKGKVREAVKVVDSSSVYIKRKHSVKEKAFASVRRRHHFHAVFLGHNVFNEHTEVVYELGNFILVFIELKV